MTDWRKILDLADAYRYLICVLACLSFTSGHVAITFCGSPFLYAAVGMYRTSYYLNNFGGSRTVR